MTLQELKDILKCYGIIPEYNIEYKRWQYEDFSCDSEYFSLKIYENTGIAIFNTYSDSTTIKYGKNIWDDYCLYDMCDEDFIQEMIKEWQYLFKEEHIIFNERYTKAKWREEQINSILED